MVGILKLFYLSYGVKFMPKLDPACCRFFELLYVGCVMNNKTSTMSSRYCTLLE